MNRNPSTDPNPVQTDIQHLKLTPRHCYIALVASMEQIIGATLSTIVGIVIPMLNLFLHPPLSAAVQGIMGAIGLIGIALGSAVIGPLSDRYGYKVWFRVCPLLIVAGSVVSSIVPVPWPICVGLFMAGFGVGGGYSLDAAYVSELMPDNRRSFMVGVAKATSAIGFILPAVFAVVVLKYHPSLSMWREVIWFMGLLGLVTLIARLRWPDSPGWLMTHGKVAAARLSARYFFGPDVTVAEPPTTGGKTAPTVKQSLFRGANLLKVIYSGVPWACEGLGVYGIGVFMPIIIMSLGIDSVHAGGIPEIISSVELTAIINFCILPGFLIGLMVVNRMNHNLMLWGGFVGSAVGLAVLLAAYILHWNVYVSVGAFMLFEMLLNAGPHLVTYIIPAAIYPVGIRGAGTGIANFLGKSGAILGVFFMPVLLKAGGVTLVLAVTIGVMLLGAVISIVFGRLIRH